MCTGRYPAAIWDPVTDRDTAPNVIERMTIHTAWVDAGDIYGPARGQSRTYAHFYNPDDGRIRQHQEVTRMARADLDANGRTVTIEHQDPRRDAPMTDAQIDADARLFAHLVLEHGLPNRIATVDDTRGLAWHRLGVDGNFGAFDPNNRRTWCRKQTGQRWTTVYGKTCPTNPRIDQIPEIYRRAQAYINPATSEEDDMLSQEEHDAIVATRKLAAWVASTLGHGGDGPTPLWWINQKLDRLDGKVNSIAGRPTDEPMTDIEVQQVASAVLQGLSPETVAAAVVGLPHDIAVQVADILAARLSTKEA